MFKMDYFIENDIRVPQFFIGKFYKIVTRIVSDCVLNHVSFFF